MASDLEKLNEEQKQAVAHKNGPLLIVAGAGTGKTTVITQRIINLIEGGEAKPEEILAVTFTEKAAAEMEERVDKLLPYGYADLWISTFHAFCERVLRDQALDIGLPSDFKILDETSAWLLVYRNLDKFNLSYYKPLGNPTKFIQSLLSHFSHCKDQGIYPEDYLNYAESLKTNLSDLPENQESERIKEVAAAFHAYQRLLLENNSLDFGDLINYCLKLFKTRPLILNEYRKKFKYILVDEFQDTNFAQYELVKILAAPKNNLAVCADDDQAIYRWRGASFNNIIQFKNDFPEVRQISLLKNYRSCQNILDLSYRFIQANNPDRLEYVGKIDKKLVAENNDPGEILHIHAKSLEEEISKTINKIEEILKTDKEANYSDFAILARSNNAAYPFAKALERAGLPYQFLASRGLYSKPIILDLISYFKLLDNYHESSALYRILGMPFLEIPEEDIMKLTRYSHKKSKSLFETIGEMPLISGISEKAAGKILFIFSLIKKHSVAAKNKAVSELAVIFLEESGYLKYLAEKDDKSQLDLLNQFFKRIKSFEDSEIDPILNNFMKEIILEIESGEEGKLEFDPETGPEVIKIMTIHGAKGLEFKYVFLVNMVDKRFPSIERKDPIEVPAELIKDIKPKGDVHLQEERRICYVAMTRAKKGLYFTSGEDYGGQRKKKLSRFLIELGYEEEMSNVKFQISNDLTTKKSGAAGERKIIKSEYLPEHFSYSQLAAFEKCPLQYKFNFILKIPVKSKGVFSFGKTIHNTLCEFLKNVNGRGAENQNNLFGFDLKVSPVKKENLFGLDYLTEIYEKKWIDEWYENKKQKEDYYKLGKKIIKEFYDEFLKNKPEILKINNEVALEIPFNLKIGDNTIRGVVDRIDKVDDGALIIDYKTGAKKEKLDADAKEQLLIYQIAAEEIFGIKPRELAYYYLEDNFKAAFLGTEKEKDLLKKKIIEEIEEIKNSDFAATPGWQCDYCDFRDICDFRQR